MGNPKKILAIVGSYRRDGNIASTVNHVAQAASSSGATVETIFLLDKNISFCTNCRTCTQEPGQEPGKCVLDDDMRDIISRIEEADGFIFGAPVNFFNVNALTRRFIERLVCYAYWPWDKNSPKNRKTQLDKQAVLITSSAMPSFLGRIFTGAMRALKISAKLVGAKTIGTIFVGLAAGSPEARLSERTRTRAEKLGQKLTS